jgi:hypothetical protein
LRTLANLFLCATALGAAASIVKPFGSAFGYLLLLVWMTVLITTALTAMGLVRDRSTANTGDRAKSPFGLLMRAICIGSVWGILALAVACHLLYRGIPPNWDSHVTGWGATTFFACLAAAQCMTVVAVCRDRGHGDSRWLTIASGVAIGMLAAPAGTEVIETLRWPIATLMPFSLLALAWAVGCAIGGASIALLLRHWRELIRDRCDGSLSHVAGHGIEALRRFINSPMKGGQRHRP